MISNRTATTGTSKNSKDTASLGSPRNFNGFSEITSFFWPVADILRGDYKQTDYGKVAVLAYAVPQNAAAHVLTKLGAPPWNRSQA